MHLISSREESTPVIGVISVAVMYDMLPWLQQQSVLIYELNLTRLSQCLSGRPFAKCPIDIQTICTDTVLQHQF